MPWILWVLSPIIAVVLIIILVIVCDKKSKLSGFVYRLFLDGRISLDEYKTLQVKSDRIFNQGYQYQQPFPDQQPFPKQTVQDFTACKNEYQQKTYYSENYQKQSAINADKVVFNANQALSGKLVRSNNSANTLLILGVSFVILAGIIFTTANWFYMTNIQRTLILALASAFFFGISVFSHKKLKLVNTGMAFYLLGTVFADIMFVMSGGFNMFGKWFCLEGDGYALFWAVSALIIAMCSAIGLKIYKKIAFLYTSLFAGGISFTMIAVQIGGISYTTALIVNLMSAVLCYLAYGSGLFSGRSIENPFKHFSLGMREIYALVTIPFLIRDFGDWNVSANIIVISYILETTFYGLKNKINAFINVQCVLLIALFGNMSKNVTDTYSGSLMFFTAAMFVLAMIYKFAEILRTKFSDYIFPITMLLSSIFITSYEMKISYLYKSIAFALLAVLVFMLALEKDRPHLAVMKWLTPVPVMGFFAGIEVYADVDDNIIMLLSMIVYMLLSGVFSIRNSDRRFESMQYAFSFTSGLMALYCSANFTSLSLLISVMVLSCILFVLCMTARNNVLSFMPVAALYLAIDQIAYLNRENWENYHQGKFIMVMVLFLLLAVLSRVLFKEKLFANDSQKVVFNAPAYAMILAPLSILYDRSYNMPNYDLWGFIAYIMLALFMLNLYRKENKSDLNQIVLTGSVIFSCIAFYERPFLVPENPIFANKLNLIPIVLFGESVKRIWKKSSFGHWVNILAFAYLVFDALRFDVLVNTLIVLSCALIILMYSFMKKRKSWFVASSCSMAGLTIYSMRRFLSDVDWWVYLLLVGILLIAVAAINEYCKSRSGENMKARAGRFFEDWTI